MTGAAELRAAFDRMHAASRAGTIATAEQRRASLATLATLVVDNARAFVRAIDDDFGGRAPSETELLEIVPAVRGIRHARGHVARWMRPERRGVSVVFQPARAWVRHEPLGVVGIIAPWNYPLLLSIAPLADALAAGNRVLLKPSELTPAFSDLFARLVAERFDPDQVTVATGGVDVARAVSSLPFDHLMFTGSTAVGREVMRAAAENLTPVTLELGGKSPAIVAPDYDLDRAARSISFGKFVNAGQTCIAPDYAMVPEADVERFAHAVLAEAERAYPRVDDPAQYSAIITDRHRERLRGAIEEARAGGATVIEHRGASGDGARIAPTIVIGAPADSVLMTQEIFGPVLPVIGHRGIDDAAAYVRARERPLALYLFAGAARTRDRLLSRAISGGVTVNGTLLHVAQDGLPFGGIGPSGIGAYHGHDGFRRFSHARAVLSIGRINMFERMGPPWGRLSRIAARSLAGLR